MRTMGEGVITAYLFINPDDCTELHWSKQGDETDFNEYAEKAWIYVGTFEIKAGKINGAYMCSKRWERKVSRDV